MMCPWIFFCDLIGAVEMIFRWHKSASLAHDSNDSRDVFKRKNLGRAPGQRRLHGRCACCLRNSKGSTAVFGYGNQDLGEAKALNIAIGSSSIFIPFHPGPFQLPQSVLTHRHIFPASSLVLKASCARIWSKAMRRLSRRREVMPMF